MAAKEQWLAGDSTVLETLGRLEANPIRSPCVAAVLN